MTLLLALIETARDLHEPGEPAGEYSRGQAELIIDAMGLDQDSYKELMIKVITHEISIGTFFEETRRA